MKMPYTQVVVAMLLLSASVAFAQENRRTIAVLDFNNNSIVDKEKLEPLRKGLADILITELSRVEAFKVVEREKIRDVVTEIEFSQTDLVDPSTAQKLGRLLGAQNLLFGGFVHSFGDEIRIDVRIVEVETGRTVKAVEETDDLDDLFDIVNEITKKLTRHFKVELTKRDKERQKDRSGTDNVEATLAYSKAVDFEDVARRFLKEGKLAEARAMYEKALESLETALEVSPKFKDAITRKESIRRRLAEL